jgi:phospholipid/cholesterol/gamma-HCH transport system permease protein
MTSHAISQPPVSTAAPPPHKPRPGWVTALGLRAKAWWADATLTLTFIGEVLLSLRRLFAGKAAMRWSDLFWQIEQAGPRSVGIVALVSGLVGVILAYMGAVQLQRVGAQSYMADLVTIGVVREVAALMTGVIISGRVGAAFAAQLGSMQANEEVDALRALGIDPVDHLVLPRMLALLLMAPLLTAFAAVTAVLCGGLVALVVFGVPPMEYLYKSSQALTLSHVLIGMSKGTVYCVLVAIAGCRQGLNAGRSAQAVGAAVTASVVQAIVWIVVAASAMTIAFQRLDW